MKNITLYEDFNSSDQYKFGQIIAKSLDSIRNKNPLGFKKVIDLLRRHKGNKDILSIFKNKLQLPGGVKLLLSLGAVEYDTPEDFGNHRVINSIEFVLSQIYIDSYNSEGDKKNCIPMIEEATNNLDSNNKWDNLRINLGKDLIEVSKYSIILFGQGVSNLVVPNNEYGRKKIAGALNFHENIGRSEIYNELEKRFGWK